MLKGKLGEGKSLECDEIHAQVKFLEGKVLTIIDASFEDNSKQKKAIKDLIKKSFGDQLSYIRQLCYPDTRMLTEDEAESTIDTENIKKEAKVID